MTDSKNTVWPHAPVHKLAAAGTYFITCGTVHKRHFFKTPERLNVLHRGLLSVAAEFHWQLEAWAVFSNHYHFVAHSPTHEENAESLPILLNKLHSKTATWINKLDATPGREVWYNYWDTHLTIEASYLARLNYVHNNPVKHGMTPVANLYPWCSASWFEQTATRAQISTIYSFKWDTLNVADDFVPVNPLALIEAIPIKSGVKPPHSR